MGAREVLADDLETAALELEKAAAHCRIASKHFSEHEVPRGCAHTFASIGHISKANKLIDTCARTHSGFAQITE